MNIHNANVAYHRNGIGGWPFWVVTFDWQHKDGSIRHMVATVPDDKGHIKRSDVVISVLDIDLLAKGVVAFGSNSWRGDDFAGAVWEAIDAYSNSI